MIGQAVRLGEQLIAEGVISEDQLAAALAKQESTGARLGNALMEIGAISAGALVNALAAKLGVPGCVLRHGLIDRGGRLKLVAVSPTCREILELTGLSGRFQFFEEPNDAARSFL